MDIGCIRVYSTNTGLPVSRLQGVRLLSTALGNLRDIDRGVSGHPGHPTHSSILRIAYADASRAIWV